MLLVALARSANEDDAKFSNEYKKLEKKTLGALINEAIKSIIFSEGSKRNLSLILKYRNWMVHDIARDILGYSIQKDGEHLLEKHLEEISLFFEGALDLIYEKIVEYSADRGICRESVEQLAKCAFEEKIEPGNYR